MQTNEGVFPEAQPERGRKVLRKLIVKRRYIPGTGYSKISTGRFHGGQLRFHERDNQHPAFSRYMFQEPYNVYVTALHYVYVTANQIAQVANAAQEAANAAQEAANAAQVANAAQGAANGAQGAANGAQVVANAGHAVYNVGHIHVAINLEWRARQADGQWGHAVFTGQSRVMYTTWWFGAGASNQDNGDWGATAGVCQLYPCQSYRTETNPGAQLGDLHVCVGLFYKHIMAANVGRRRYIRGPIQGLDHNLAATDAYTTSADSRLHNIGSVQEILDNELIPNPQFGQHGLQYTAEAEHRFAIYVCAGARLVVTDEHNYLGAHNRTLIQQGGVVVVEMRLYWAPPTPVVHPNGRFRALTTPQAVAAGFLDTQVQAVRDRLNGIENPVVFLGPTESDLETHCWGLHICQHDGHLRAFLSAPERGIVTGIEDFAVGMEEIMARHKYEQLYGQVFTRENFGFHYCCRGFEVPIDAILEKILGMEPRCDQWLQINYHVGGIYAGNQAPANAPAPGAYRSIRCTQRYVSQTVRLQPPMRALSPLFYLRPIDDNGQAVGPLDYKWAPTNTDHEVFWRRKGYDWYRLAFGTKWEKYSLTATNYYWVHEKVAAKCDYNTTVVDGWHKRVALSGWIYHKQAGNAKVATYKYPVYKRADNWYYQF